jgi:hypothetical protein
VRDFTSRGKIAPSFEKVQEKGPKMGLLWNIVLNELDSYTILNFFINWVSFQRLYEGQKAMHRKQPPYFRMGTVQLSYPTAADVLRYPEHELKWGGQEGIENEIRIHSWVLLGCNKNETVNTGLRVEKLDPWMMECYSIRDGRRL